MADISAGCFCINLGMRFLPYLENLTHPVRRQTDEAIHEVNKHAIRHHFLHHACHQLSYL